MTPSSRDLLDLRCHSRGIRLSQWQNANGVQGFHVFSQTLGNKAPNTYQTASASWESLYSYATTYKNLTSNASGVSSPFVWDVIQSQRSQNITPSHYFNYKHKQRLHPQIARFQFLVYARALEDPSQPDDADPKRYLINVAYVPVFTLWNPYNITITQNIASVSPNAGTSALGSTFLGFGWRRSPPGVMAIVNRQTYPDPGMVPSNQYRLFTPGNFQTLDRHTNNANPYDNALPQNTAKYGTGNNSRWIDKRTFGCWLPNGTLTFKPGEVKVFSPQFVDNAYDLSGVMRLREGYNPADIIGVEFWNQNHTTNPAAGLITPSGTPGGNLRADQSVWFLMRTDKVTQPFLDREPGVGFSLSFGPGGTHFGGNAINGFSTMPSGVGENELHNLTSLVSEEDGITYWPPTEVDEVGYTVAELASGPWLPIFSISFGPRMTLGTGPGMEQNRPTKGVVQNNPLASIVLSEPGSGHAKDHPANITYDFAYHSLSIGSNVTPNLSDSNGFIATGYRSGDGLSRLVMNNIPLRPMASLVELESWNPRGHNPFPPFQSNLIGNSDATPLIPRSSVVHPELKPSHDANGLEYTLAEKQRYNLMHDDAYCANHLLFDDWFLSSIAPDPTNFGQQTARDINTVYRDFLLGDSRLPNRAYLPITEDRNLTNAEATARIGEIITSNDGWLKVASRFEVEGMFNVNSTSVEAWKALLGHARSIEQIALHGANGIVANNVSNQHVVTRSEIAPDVEAGSGSGVAGQFANASEYAGFRSLTDDQIEDLAEKIVDQVRLRGPFLSLSEFVNRQLSEGTDLALAGAVQTAINNLTIDPMAELRNPANSLSANTMPANDPKLSNVGYEFPQAAVGSSAYGAPGWIRQADILRPIAPILSVRDDTFTIRAYGDARDRNGAVIAQAWCEAVVRRSREFTDSTNAADVADPPSGVNAQFGRRYEMISFRWLNSGEV